MITIHYTMTNNKNNNNYFISNCQSFERFYVCIAKIRNNDTYIGYRQKKIEKKLF